MNNCVLPATGASTTGLIVIAAVAIVAGLDSPDGWPATAPYSIVLALCVAIGLAGWAQPAQQRPTARRPPTRQRPTRQRPTRQRPARQRPARPPPPRRCRPARKTTSTPSSCAGASGSGNILTNDSLGTPPAVLADLFDLDTASFAADGSTFDVLDGLIPVAYADRQREQ